MPASSYQVVSVPNHYPWVFGCTCVVHASSPRYPQLCKLASVQTTARHSFLFSLRGNDRRHLIPNQPRIGRDMIMAVEGSGGFKRSKLDSRTDQADKSIRSYLTIKHGW